MSLTGTVDGAIAMRQAQQIAEEVAGVTHVHNLLTIRLHGERQETPGDVVNAALGSGEKR